jgi:hypothetical protein
MARKVYENNYKVYWLTSCANIQSPTTAEIAAGKYIGAFLTKDGAALNTGQNAVDTAGIDSLWDTQIGGSTQMSPEFKLFRDGTSETNGWDLIVQGTQGFVLISTFGTPIAGSKAIVIPAEMGIAKPANSAANTAQTFTVSFFMTAQPAQKAVVV